MYLLFTRLYERIAAALYCCEHCVYTVYSVLYAAMNIPDKRSDNWPMWLTFYPTSESTRFVKRKGRKKKEKVAIYYSDHATFFCDFLPLIDHRTTRIRTYYTKGIFEKNPYSPLSSFTWISNPHHPSPD